VVAVFVYPISATGPPPLSCHAMHESALVQGLINVLTAW
jgi:hypothetical protein